MSTDLKTLIWHEFNEDGSDRLEHCCGCWTFRIEPDPVPWPIVAVCNECGERRIGSFPGIINPQDEKSFITTDAGKAYLANLSEAVNASPS